MAHRRGLFFMLFLVLYYVVYMMTFSVLFAAFGIPAIVSSLWFQMFFQVTVLLLPLAIWLALFREKINAHLPHMSLGNTNILYLVGLSIFIQPALMTVSGLTNLLFPNEIGEFVLNRMDYPFWMLLLAIAVTPAICEEVVFRGYLQSTYKDKSFWVMALVNGLFFGIIHFNAHQFFFAFLAGIFFAYIVHATRSIRAGVISHFLMNASQVSLLWFATRLPYWLETLAKILGNIAEQYDPDFELPIETAYDFTDPEMFGAVIFMIITIALIVITSSIFAYLLFRGFDAHNKKRVADYEAKIAAEAAETPNETPNEDPKSEPAEKRKNLIFDGAIILAIVAVYVFIVFGIPLF